ncbi:FAD-linked reductase, partial [Phaeosphaeriaceae sp. SRC1lsM3a]
DSVLVLEYGTLNNDPSILLPADTLTSHADRFYNITSLPIPGLNNVTRSVLAGALVGGGSAVNGMFFDRGSASDYDAWETLGNGAQWNFEGLLPYFRKSVTFTPPTQSVNVNYTWDEAVAYGGKGEIQVSFPPYQFPGQEYVWAAWSELGIKEPKEAAGGEAIGAIQAPSGIGPKSVLDKAGITVKKNLPGVGANFQDHPIGGGFWNWTKNAPSPVQGDILTNKTLYAEAEKEYAASRTGPLSVARGNQAAFLPLKVVAAEKWKGLVESIAGQDATAYLPAQYEETLLEGFKAQQKLTAELLARDDSAAYEFPFGGGPLGGGVLERPLSRGTININTSNPLSEPVVDYRTFSNPLDVQVAIPIIDFARKFNSLNAFSSLGAVEVSPGKNVTSDVAIADYLRNIIPYLPATHLCTTVYAVAEKAADLIKERTSWVA